jgi:LEA14-like dessication related protein|tara:strand:- start:332 stop:796 length:465 start_codon:yes stop_codon:yes gene_type:complete
MKNNFKTLSIVAILAISTLTGCYKQLEVINVEDFSEVVIGLKGLRSNLDVNIYNPNFYPIELDETQITLRVRDVDAGYVSLSKIVNIGARDTATIRLHVVTREGAIAEILKKDVLNFLKGEEVPFSASGIVSGKSWGVKIEVPLEHSQNISLRK